MKIKIIHIDDEKLARDGFKCIIEDYFPEIDLIGQAGNALEGIKLINQLSPDIVFLDVSMPGGSGFDMLESLPTMNFKLVFLTAYSEYAINAIKKGAFDYLLKPIDEEELQRVFEKHTHSANKISTKSKLYINTQNSLEIVSIHEILYLKSDNNYTYITLANSNPILSSKSLSHYEKMLPEDIFYKVHQSFIVNKTKVKRIIKEDNGILVMIDNSQIPVSRRNKAEVSQLFKN